MEAEISTSQCDCKGQTRKHVCIEGQGERGGEDYYEMLTQGLCLY